MNTLNIFFLSLLCLQGQLQPALSQPEGTKCSDDSSTCKCNTKDGVIDLNPIVQGSTPPKFHAADVQGPNDFGYDYNPCVSYDDISSCAGGVHICQIPNSDPTAAFEVASANTEAIYIDNNGNPYVYYTGSEGRDAKVDLKCDQTAAASDVTVVANGEEPPLHYEFTLTGCQACPGGCSGSSGPATKTGVQVGVVGIVLIFVVIGGLMVYFVVGAVIMKVKYQAAGSDIIPNKMFWIALPGLIKEGFVCTFGPPFRFIRAKIRGEQGYEPQKDSV